MSTLDEITKEKQRVSEALARVDAQREKLTGQLGELEATERVLARYSTGTRNQDGFSQDVDHGNEGGRSSAITWAPAHYDRKTSWRQAHLADPRRSGPCLGNRQDATGDHRCVQGGSPEPCRCRHCPAQAGWPHRTARREALRDAV